MLVSSVQMNVGLPPKTLIPPNGGIVSLTLGVGAAGGRYSATFSGVAGSEIRLVRMGEVCILVVME